jgi:beta-glucosidase
LGPGTKEEYGKMFMQAGKSCKILVKYGTSPTMKFRVTGVTNFGAGRLRLGAKRLINPKDEFEAAFELAKTVGQVIIFAGLNLEWESEGYDCDNMHPHFLDRPFKCLRHRESMINCSSSFRTPSLADCVNHL